MQNPINRFAPGLYAAMRVAVGLSFTQHGLQKMFGLLGGVGSGGQAQLFSLLGAAGVIEFFGGLLIALGLYGSLVAFIAVLEMIYAYSTVHAPRGGAPIENGGELAVLYGFVFLYIAARGSGPFSLDAWRRRSR